jgi:hypothetical protein
MSLARCCFQPVIQGGFVARPQMKNRRLQKMLYLLKRRDQRVSMPKSMSFDDEDDDEIDS